MGGGGHFLKCQILYILPFIFENNFELCERVPSDPHSIHTAFGKMRETEQNHGKIADNKTILHINIKIIVCPSGMLCFVVLGHTVGLGKEGWGVSRHFVPICRV